MRNLTLNLKQKAKAFWQNNKGKWWLWLIVWLLVSIVLLKYDRRTLTIELKFMSWGIIGLLGFILCVYFTIKSKSTRKKMILAYVSIIPLCLFIGEIYAYFYLQMDNKKAKIKTECETLSEGGYNNSMTEADIVGYKSKIKNESFTSHRILKESGETIYNVIYTNDENANRITPNNNTKSNKCLLLFGDSFTYGEGLNDNETLAFFINETNDKAFRIYNFGLHGYGPHNALALLKSGEVERVLEKQCSEMIAIYESLPGHIARANLFSEWELSNKKSPKFKLINNELIWINNPLNSASKPRKRSFTERLNDSIEYRKQKSYLYELFAKPNEYKYSEKYNETYFAIMQEMRAELKAKFNSDLLFLLWDSNNLSKDLEIKESNAIIKWLESVDLPYFLISQMISDYKQDRLKYGIHTCDLHPNALANEKIAEFLAEKIKNGEIKSYPVKQNHTQKDKNDTK